MTNIKEKLAQPPVFENLGKIANPAIFSARCSDIFNAKGTDGYINWTPDNGYDLEAIPKQFHPAIFQAIEAHEKSHPGMHRCNVHYNQGILKPNDNFRAKNTHFDASVEAYPDTAYANNDVFIVSDNLPTQISLQTFDMPDRLYFEDHMELGYKISAILKEQVSEDHIVTPEAYDLVRFDSFTVHRAQFSPKPTERTFLMVRFC